MTHPWHVPPSCSICQFVCSDCRTCTLRQAPQLAPLSCQDVLYASPGVVSKEFWKVLDCDEAMEWVLLGYTGAASAAGQWGYGTGMTYTLLLFCVNTLFLFYVVSASMNWPLCQKRPPFVKFHRVLVLCSLRMFHWVPCSLLGTQVCHTKEPCWELVMGHTPLIQGPLIVWKSPWAKLESGLGSWATLTTGELQACAPRDPGLLHKGTLRTESSAFVYHG